MSQNVSAEYIQQVMAAQGCEIAAPDAEIIATTLGNQLGAADHDYKKLAFEAEPSAFNAHLVKGAGR